MRSVAICINTLVFALSLFIGLSSSALAQQTTGLVGHWTFDDGTGKDFSGYRNDAKLGGAKIHSLGESRACALFLRDADPLQIPASAVSPLAIERGTICFWLNAGWDRTTILEYDNGAMELNDYRGDFQVRFQGPKDFKYGSLILDYNWPKYDMREWAFYGHPKAAIGDSEWHLFAVTYDDQNKKIVGWRDGEVISTVDLSKVKTEPLKREGLTSIATGEGFMGFLDDLRIYNKVLSAGEVREIYESTRSIYANRKDTIPHDRRQETYKYEPEDRTLYHAWLQHDPPSEETVLSNQIIAEGGNSTIKTAAAELQVALPTSWSGPRFLLGTAKTSSSIREHAEELKLDQVKDDGFVLRAIDGGKTIVVAGREPAGVVFGTFDLIRRIKLATTGVRDHQPPGVSPRFSHGIEPAPTKPGANARRLIDLQQLGNLDVLENPKIPLRMVDHWSYFRGFPHDAWRGGGRDNSIYSWEELRTGDTKLIRDWVRMMASAGWNAICPSEVNWHYRDNFLEHLDEVEILAGIMRDYGMKLYWSPSYLLALDQNTADALYDRVPDFGGYMMKLGSEKQNGDPRPPMVNRIADALKPHGGKVVVRAFVYGNYRYTPEPYRNLIPYDLFAHEDGNFRDNVIVCPKGSPMDWDFSAPIPALDGAIQKNMSGSEIVIDKGWPVSWVEKWKWWLEQDNYRRGPGSLNKLDVDCIMGVSMIEPRPAWTDCPLNMVNYYGLGRLAWNPDLTVDEIYSDWIRQTFGADQDVLDTTKTILLMLDDITRKLYNYRGYRGVWLSGDDGMTESKTPFVVNRDGIGPRTSELGKRILNQYAPGLRETYGDPVRGEAFLTTFHFAKHDQRLSIGRTLIQDVYGNMEEAIAMADQVVQMWKTLEGKIDEHRYQHTLKSLTEYADNTRGTRDKMTSRFEENTGRKREDVLAGLTKSALAKVHTYNVRHFGAVADGKTDDTPAFNKAIVECEAAGGGTVFVPSGIYAVRSVESKSKVTLALDVGAVLKSN